MCSVEISLINYPLFFQALPKSFYRKRSNYSGNFEIQLKTAGISFFVHFPTKFGKFEVEKKSHFFRGFFPFSRLKIARKAAVFLSISSSREE